MTRGSNSGTAEEKEELNLTSQELQVLSELDSRQFGFLKLKSAEHTRTRALVLKAVAYLEGMLVQVKEEDRHDISIDPKTYCKLGHFHLLLEDYAKAISAYQKFYALEKENWRDPLFLYGLGLCYYHYNAFECSMENLPKDHDYKVNNYCNLVDRILRNGFKNDLFAVEVGA